MSKMFIGTRAIYNGGNSKNITVPKAILKELESNTISEFMIFLEDSLNRITKLCDVYFFSKNLFVFGQKSIDYIQKMFLYLFESLKTNININQQTLVLKGLPSEIFKVIFLIDNLIESSKQFLNKYLNSLQSSIYYMETNSMFKLVFKQCYDKNFELFNKCITIGFNFVKSNISKKLLKFNKNDFSIIKTIYFDLKNYLNTFNCINSVNMRNDCRFTFYKLLIDLIEDIILKSDLKTILKIDFQSELSPFFEIFSEININGLNGDINALRYLIIILSTKERNIYKIIDLDQEKEINISKLEIYNDRIQQLVT